MKDNLISVIVPVFNAERFIRNTLETVKNQTYSNWEMICVDDCSTDNSSKIIEDAQCKDSRIKLIKLKENLGVAMARNEGIKVAKGNFIAFLDADDLWQKDKLKKQINFMNRQSCAFCFTGYEFADEQGKPKGKIVEVPDKVNYKQALKNTTIWTSTVMFNMNMIEKDLIKMPNIKSEDTATWWRILKNGYEGFGLKENLSYYRRSKGTLSSDKKEAVKRIWNLYRKQEKLGIIYSSYNFVFWAINAIKRRI